MVAGPHHRPNRASRSLSQFPLPRAVAISEDGSAVTCLQYFERHGSHFYTNYRLSTAATPTVGRGNWTFAGDLFGPAIQSRDCAVAVANKGLAGLVARRDGTTVGLTRQGLVSGWTAPVALGPGFAWWGGYSNFASDRAGHAIVLGIDAFGQPSATLERISVDLAANRWSAPTPVSGPNRIDVQESFTPPYSLDVAPDGFTTIAWWDQTAPGPGQKPPIALAITGSTTTSTFLTPTKLFTGSYGSYVLKVAVASGGQAQVGMVSGVSTVSNPYNKGLYVSSFAKP